MTILDPARRPAADELAPFYQAYVDRAPDGDVRDVLRAQQDTFRGIAAAAAGRETHAYAAGKWTVREVVGHLGDAERVFGHRLFCISRGEQAPLPGFDENVYAAAGGAAGRPLPELADELVLLREVNRRLVGTLDESMWSRVGVANGKPVSARALAWILAGHAAHHLEILRSRYDLAV